VSGCHIIAKKRGIRTGIGRSGNTDTNRKAGRKESRIMQRKYKEMQGVTADR
jgi:hypothetical protein